ncbi:N-acetylmuramoyl-L-alanine amidase [Lunatibacter salilacus]|uniref:N-acetylmuramoyl-L-alanine amidase n=1 Tax=Lunatibacter salilacus TaxID=2483804 RepID=UPI00131A9F54|nr:N-acetylmuramoyl-L-alanine amidase [Lunatibacter salilacus]
MILFLPKGGRWTRSVVLLLIIPILFLVGCPENTFGQQNNVLNGKIICLDPGHGGTAATDSYRVGPTGEREEWINLRVGMYLKKMLQKQGATVLMTREADVQVALADRAELAVNGKADVFISIHHNATADRSVNFPILYFHGSAMENEASVLLGKLIAKEFRETLFDSEGPVSLVSDFAIFPNAGAGVLRGTYGIPAILAEASFFSKADEEKRLKKKRYNKQEAKAYVNALTVFFEKEEIPPVREKSQPLTIPPFPVFQEAERMRPEALLWKENYLKGKELVEQGDPSLLEEAMEYLDLSVRSFADSYVAREAHLLRSKVLQMQGKKDEAATEALRAEAFYVPVP